MRARRCCCRRRGAHWPFLVARPPCVGVSVPVALTADCWAAAGCESSTGVSLPSRSCSAKVCHCSGQHHKRMSKPSGGLRKLPSMLDLILPAPFTAPCDGGCECDEAGGVPGAGEPLCWAHLSASSSCFACRYIWLTSWRVLICKFLGTAWFHCDWVWDPPFAAFVTRWSHSWLMGKAVPPPWLSLIHI